MSDSDLGGFDRPMHVPLDFNTAAGSSKLTSSRAQAGPSRTAGTGSTTATRKKVAHNIASEEEDPAVNKGKALRHHQKQETDAAASDADIGVVEIDGEDIEELTSSPQNNKIRSGSKKPSPLSGSAATHPLQDGPTNKRKGKVKSKLRAQSVDDVEHNGIEMVEDKMDVDNQGPESTNATERTTAHVVKNGKSVTRAEQRLREQLDQANKHLSDLTRQMNELLMVRLTEPEQLLERMEAQHHSQTKVHDNLIEDLKAKLAQSDPLLRSDKTAVFELLTREEADKEMEKLQQQLKSYRDIVHERDRITKQKDERINTLEQENKELSFELKMEIERGKQFADKLAEINQKQPQSVQRTNAGSILSGNKDPKMTEIIKFYEDLTNVIIPSIKTQPGRYLNTSEWLMNCCYTYKDVTDKDAEPKSLMFAVRLCRDLKAGESEPVESLDQLVESVHYIPRELDKETPEFVESLGFLQDTFTFERDQLSLFLRTLHDNISGEGNDKGDADASSDESVVIMK